VRIQSIQVAQSLRVSLRNVIYCRVSQLQAIGRPHNSLRTSLRVALLHTCTKMMEGGFELTTGRYVQTVSYAKRWLNEKAVGLTKLGKAQRVTDLLCAVLNMMSHSWQKFSLLIYLLT
jgi:hypothetical protein